MPVFSVQLDANGAAQWIIPIPKLRTLTIINDSGAPVVFAQNGSAVKVTLNNGIEVEFEEEEAESVQEIDFSGGTPNGSLKVSWA